MPHYTFMRNAWMGHSHTHDEEAPQLYPEEPGHGTASPASTLQAMDDMEQQQQQAMDHVEQQQQQPGHGPYGADSVTRMNRPGIA